MLCRKWNVGEKSLSAPLEEGRAIYEVERAFTPEKNRDTRSSVGEHDLAQNM
jgi:hypothetical protein